MKPMRGDLQAGKKEIDCLDLRLNGLNEFILRLEADFQNRMNRKCSQLRFLAYIPFPVEAEAQKLNLDFKVVSQKLKDSQTDLGNVRQENLRLKTQVIWLLGGYIESALFTIDSWTKKLKSKK